MTLNGDREGQPQLPSPILRILIIHLNLHERCMNGESLGECASLEELSEHILYYHRERHIDNGMADRNDDNSKSNNLLMQDAVQFLGLCTALYTLPSSLILTKTNEELDPSNSDEYHDKTKAIYFEKSTLVFIPLESSKDVLAVVQVGRSSIGEYTSNTGSGDPLAIQSSIERSHKLFCLLNGGGILYRLNGGTSKTPKNLCPYQGMDQLFGLLKKLRKTKDQLHRCVTNKEDQYTQIDAQINALVDEIRLLRQGLTIQSIRKDLDEHYREYLSDYSLIASRNGGAGRCLVEVPPVPIAQDSGGHTLQVPHSFANRPSIMLLTKAIHETICAHPPMNVDSHGLYAISIFHEGQLLHSETSPESHILVSNEFANLLMAYMASYQSKMNHIAGNREASPEVADSASSLSYPKGLRSLTRSIGSMAGALTKDDVSPQHTHDSHVAQRPLDPHHRGRFLTTPPSYMLSVSHQTYSIEVGDNMPSIWAPLVHLPLGRQTSEEETFERSSTGVHMVMFRFMQFSFLVFLRLAPQADPPLDTNRLLIMKLEEELSEAVLLAINDETVDASDAAKDVMEWTNSPNQDIILLERNKYRMVLLQDPIWSTSRHDLKFKKSNEKQQSHRFLGYGTRKKESTATTSSTTKRSVMDEWSALGLDCRHLLASCLPLDVCLAFDDMINEMTARRTRYGEVPDRSLELCTCMSVGWVYAFGKGDKEIYVFFDNSIYVTVADVQSAAKRIRETFTAI